MAVKATNENSILLNGYKYKVSNPVKRLSLSQFPSKMQIGDNSYDNRRILSSWSISGERGNGVEEMNEKEDAGKAWFTNCITEYKNHLLPPRLATGISAPTTPAAPTIVNADFELDANWTQESGTCGQSTDYARSATHSWKCNAGVAYQDVAGFIPGATYTFKCWGLKVGGTNVYLSIYDGVTDTPGTGYEGGTFSQMSVTKTISPNSTVLRLRLNGSTTAAGYFDDATLEIAALPAIGTPNLMANFNGEMYVAFGRILAKLASGRAAFTVVADMGATITALIPSLDSKIIMGTSPGGDCGTARSGPG